MPAASTAARINFISYDDAYSPPKNRRAGAQAGRERRGCCFIFNSLGTPPNSAIHKYMNSKKVPQLFVATGRHQVERPPRTFPGPWGWQPNYQSETQIYAKYLLKNKPDAKIAVLYQNDDYGKGLFERPEGRSRSQGSVDDHRRGKLRNLGAHHRQSYRQAGKRPGADVFVDIATPKFAAQAIKKVAEIEWKPLHFLNNVSASVGSRHQAGRL